MKPQMPFYITYAIRWLQKIICIQLFITIVSLPILMAWGLPISLMSPIGNIVFAPFLTLFLFLSSTIFITQLVCLPNGILVYALEQLTAVWLWLLDCSQPGWLIGFPSIPYYWYLFLLIALITIVYNKHLRTIRQLNGALSILLILFIAPSKWSNTRDLSVQSIACHNKEVILISIEKTITLIDPGVIGQKLSASSWAEYTLPADLCTTYGATHIDHLILCKPGIRLFQTVTKLISCLPVKSVYIGYWHEQNPKLARAFMQLKEAASLHKTTIHRLNQYPMHITLAKYHTLTVESHNPAGMTISFNTPEQTYDLIKNNAYTPQNHQA